MLKIINKVEEEAEQGRKWPLQIAENKSKIKEFRNFKIINSDAFFLHLLTLLFIAQLLFYHPFYIPFLYSNIPSL